MRLYKAQVCPISDESKVAKFLFPSPLQFFLPFYGWIETCCPDLLHQIMNGPYSLCQFMSARGTALVVLLLFTAVAFAFTFGCSGCGVICIGEYCESIP